MDVVRGNAVLINEGDRVKVYYYGCLDFIGVVTSVTHYGLYITEDGFYSAHNECPFHPKQCRKLSSKVDNKNPLS